MAERHSADHGPAEPILFPERWQFDGCTLGPEPDTVSGKFSFSAPFFGYGVMVQDFMSEAH